MFVVAYFRPSPVIRSKQPARRSDAPGKTPLAQAARKPRPVNPRDEKPVRNDNRGGRDRGAKKENKVICHSRQIHFSKVYLRNRKHCKPSSFICQ